MGVRSPLESQNYSIRTPQRTCTCTFHLPLVKHDFAEQRLDYQLIKLLNSNESTAFTLRAQSLFFYFFKTFVKYYILNNYVDRCYDVH